MDSAPEYATIPNTVARFGISRTTLYRMFAAGLVEAVKCNGRTLVRVATVRALLDNAPRAEFRAPREAA